MIPRASYFRSTIGRKQLVSVTGIGMAIFVLIHMAGNLLIFAGAEAYNRYSHAITSNHLLLYSAEVGLLACFVIHVILTLQLTIENRRARSHRYALTTSGRKGVSPASKTMIYHGTILAVFIILHLITFKYGPYYEIDYGGTKMRDLHRLVMEVFAQPGYVAWYCIALVFLGLHLSHGVGSLFQTLGFNHPHYNRAIRVFSYAYSLVVAAGFISQPLYVFLKG